MEQKSQSRTQRVPIKHDFRTLRVFLFPILFVIFMDRVSRHSHGEEGVWFGNLRVASLLFEDDVVLLASSIQDFQ